jgi:hypothetical protein
MKFHPGIPDIGGQETCFLPVKRNKPARGRPGRSGDGANLLKDKQEKID